MLKTFSDKFSSTASDIKESISEGVSHSTNFVSEKISDAASAVSEKAILTSVEQIRNVLEITVRELEKKPISEFPTQITSSFSLSMITVQIEITIPGQILNDKVAILEDTKLE